MKRILCLLLALMMILLCACGSGSQPDPTQSPSASPSATPSASPSAKPSPSADPQPSADPEPTPSVEPSPEPVLAYVNPLTGMPMAEDTASYKPVAIMLNNIKAAMPQQGNSQADIIYEVLAEVGIYHDVSNLDIVGSVRSARLYYWDLALGHDAIFVHAGGSDEFYNYKSSRELSTVDGVKGYYSYATTGLFWRDRERIDGKYYAYEHSLITSGEKLTEILGARGEFGTHAEGYTYPITFKEDGTPSNGQNATMIIAPFSNSKATTFRYDRDTGLYYAEQYGGAMIDGNDGSQIAVTNVIILKTKCVTVDDAGRQSVDLSSGEGWFACGGRLIPIKWEKSNYDQPLRYYTTDGKALSLGQGKSYVCIIPLNRDAIYE